MKRSYENIMAENERRVKTLQSPYDPVVGIGSLMDRISIALDDNTEVHIPVEMEALDAVQVILQEGTLERAARLASITFDSALYDFSKLRCKYDFEFWGATCVNIKTKEEGVKKFVLKRPQRRYSAELERQRLLMICIQIILLKGRQWGGSTNSVLYMSWIQLFWKRYWNALICGQLQSSANHIRGMYEFMAGRHPAGYVDYAESIVTEVYEKTQNYRIIPGRECIFGVGSSENPDAIRSMTYHLLHLTEVSSWKSTEKIKAEDLIASIRGGFVKGNKPFTMVVLESTAKGIGNYHASEWEKAVNGKSNFTPIFIPWFDDPSDTMMAVGDYKKFIESWEENGYEYELFDLGASVEQIKWYNFVKKDYPNQLLMKQEHPSTPEEAFQTTERRVFDRIYVNNIKKTVRDPIAVGNLIGDSAKGENSLRNIKFVVNGKGFIKIWTKPNLSGMENFGKIYTNRYVGFADIGGRTAKADFGSITILDRIWMVWGGNPKVCAEWHGHIDLDLFAWEACRLGMYYNKALLAFEMNSITKRAAEQRDSETDHSYTVVDTIKDFYPNLYYRIQPETVKENWDGKVGFHTNKKTKPMIIDSLMSAMRDLEYEEMSIDAINEFDWYETKDNGSFGAIEGKKDDRVVSRAGAYYLHTKMNPCMEVDAPTERKKRERPVEAGIF